MNGSEFWIAYTLLMVVCTLAFEYRALQQGKLDQQNRSQMSNLDYLAGVFKGLASLGFLGCFYQHAELDQDVDYVQKVVLGIALLASAIGDVLLVGKRQVFFLLGLIAFFVAHLAYAFVFLEPVLSADLDLINLVNGGMSLSVILISFFAYRYFHPHIPKDLVYPAMAYTGVIGLMMSIALVHAVSLYHYTVAIGAVAFWLSDLAVAKQQFQADHLRQDGFYVRLWGLPLYYVAQIILGSSVG